jgi:hypothetical protein
VLVGPFRWEQRAWCLLHSATTAHLTCGDALRITGHISRRSEWWRSTTLIAGPCVSLLESGDTGAHDSSGWGEAPLVLQR